MTLTGPDLAVRPSRRTTVIGVLLLAAAGVAGGAWYVTTPAELPVSTATVVASTPVGIPVYVGMFAPGPDFDRTLALSGVKVHTTSNTAVDVVPLLCRGGTVGVTTDPEPFCDELVNPEGQRLTGADSIVLQVSSADPAIAVIDQVRLGFREGLRAGTLVAGRPATVRVLAR